MINQFIPHRSLKIYVLVAIIVQLASPCPSVRSQAQPSGVRSQTEPEEDFLSSFREFVYSKYKPSGKLDPSSYEKLKIHIAQACGNKVNVSLLDRLFDTSDEKKWKESWDILRSSLPSGSNWYLSPTIDPLSRNDDKASVSVILGVLNSSKKTTITVAKTTIPLQIFYLGAGAVRSRSQFEIDRTTWDLANTTDMVIFSDGLEKSLGFRKKIRDHFIGLDPEPERARLCSHPDQMPPWQEVGSFLLERHLISIPAESIEKDWLEGATFAAAGEILALRDDEFVFALQHSGLSLQDAIDVLFWRGNLAMISDSEQPDMGIAAMALNAGEMIPGKPLTPLQSVSVTEIANFAATLSGQNVNGGEHPSFNLADTLLSPSLDAARIRRAADQRFPHALAENKMRLLGSSFLHGEVFSHEEKIKLLSISEHALRDFPDGEVIKMLAGEIFVQTGKENEGEILLRDVEDHCKADYLRAGAEQGLGILCFNRQQFRDASHWLESSEKLQPDDTTTLYMLYKALSRTGETAEAVKVKARFLELRPKGERANELRQAVP